MKNKKWQQIVFYVLAFFLFVFPLHRVSSTIPSIAFILFSLFSVFTTKQNIINTIKKHPIVAVSILYFLICILGVFYTTDLSEFIAKAKLKIYFLLIPLLLFSQLEYLKTREKELSIIALLGGIFAALFLIVVAVFRYKTIGSNAFFYGYLVEIIHVNPILYSILFNIYILIAYFKIEDVKVKFIIISFLSVFILMLLSKAGVIILFLILLYIIIKNFALNYKTLAVFIVFISILSSLFYLSKDNDTLITRFNFTKFYLTHRHSENANEQFPRVIMFNSGIKIIKENFLFGVGITNTRKALKKEFENKGFKQGIIQNYDAHNQFLETGIASGVIGLLCIFSLFLFLFRNALKLQNKPLLLFLLLYVFVSLIQNTFESQMGVFIFFLFSFLFYIMKTDRVEV